METLFDIATLRVRIQVWRSAGLRVVLVPTMGNLHQGHLSLIARAKQLGDRVVATIFVNPTQFGPREDFASYPRTLDADQARLRDAGCDLLMVPAVSEVYPRGTNDLARVEVPGLDHILCGRFRPGHFSAVATIVVKLLNMVQPDVAVFGQKDFQQLMVIRRVVADLNLPVLIESVDTQREESGLAMSSRNQYLSAAERTQAAELRLTLLRLREQVIQGSGFATAERDAVARLEAAGFSTEYVEIRRQEDLAVPEKVEHTALVALAAVRLGKTRLIDNILI